jgi:hypothetical protein
VGALLEDLAEEDDGGDEGHGFEIQRGAVGGAEGGREVIAEDGGGDAEGVGGAGAGHDHGEHVRVALAEEYHQRRLKGKPAQKNTGVVRTSWAQARVAG